MTDFTEEMEEVLAAAERAREAEERPISAVQEDFLYDSSQDKYWYLKTGRLLKPNAVNAEISRALWASNAEGDLIKPSIELAAVERGLLVSGSTWWPGQPQVIANTKITESGTEAERGMRIYNAYRPPDHTKWSDKENPDRWIEHVKKLYPDPVEHETFFDWAAHALQLPGVKANFHPIVSGAQGIGKDLMIAPIRAGVGIANQREIDPHMIHGKENAYVQSVLLIINEGRPHEKEHYASAFYNKLKVILAAPPEWIPMRRLFQDYIYVRNCCHVLLTTNDPLTIYIPPEDRRLFVMHSDEKAAIERSDSENKEMRDLWNWMKDEGGIDAAVRWLLRREIRTDFNGEAPMTSGKEEIQVSTGQRNTDSSTQLVEDYIEKVYHDDWPPVIFLTDLVQYQKGEFGPNEKSISYDRGLAIKMSAFGYRTIKNKNAWINTDKNGKAVFKSKVAFVSRSKVDRSKIDAEIYSAVKRRPIEFGNATAAAADAKGMRVVENEREK